MAPLASPLRPEGVAAWRVSLGSTSVSSPGVDVAELAPVSYEVDIREAELSPVEQHANTKDLAGVHAVARGVPANAVGRSDSDALASAAGRAREGGD